MANLRLVKRENQKSKPGGRGIAAWITALTGFVGALKMAGLTERSIVLIMALVLFTVIVSVVLSKGGH